MTEYFLSILSENVAKYPERIAYCLDDGSKAMTYSALWSLSGRIYSKLKRIGIGKEDVIRIILPREPILCAALVGVWRAGAALVAMETGTPSERAEFIRKDANCRLTIDLAFMEDIEQYTPEDGFVLPSPHDAAFAVYTSGTTGTPKGVLHEYGKFGLIVKGARMEEAERDHFERYALTPSFHFVASLMGVVIRLVMADTVYLVSGALLRDFEAFQNFLLREQIDITFMTPSMLRICRNFSPYLRVIQTGSEPANGIYCERPLIRNKYGMSESAFFVAEFDLDRVYDKAPVGRNRLGLEIRLLKDDGQKAERGEQGEICLEDPYTRGYINLPEQTARAFRDGMFHTGDIGYYNEDGNLVLCGRMDDMLKINGNRLEPAEVEAAAKEILHVRSAVAKGFQEGDTAFVVLYCLKSEIDSSFDEDKLPILREKMGKKLPPYMIPAYYVALDEFPLNENRKISRRHLPRPDRIAENTACAAPETALQKRLCDAMAKALNLPRVSVTDDFFGLGGNSIAVMSFLSMCEGLGLSTEVLRDCPTPAKLAEYCEDREMGGEAAEPISGRQAWILEKIRFQQERYGKAETIPAYYASSQGTEEGMIRKVLWNPEISCTLTENVNPERLQAAVDRAVSVCPFVTLSVEKNPENGLLYFRKNMLPLAVRPKKEADILRVFGTEEENGHYARVSFSGSVIYFSMCHALTDGFGFNCFIQAVLDFYFGKSETVYQGTKQADYAADLMEFPLPVQEGFLPADPVPEKHFLIPEIGDSERIMPRMVRGSVPRPAMQSLMKRYGISAQTAVSYLLALCVLKTHPENRLPVCIRGPVNTRGILGVPNTFQNASIPHVYLTVDPSCWNSGDTAALLNGMQKSLDEQLSYDCLAYETNRIGKVLREGNPQSFAATMQQYRRKTDLLANYMGEMLTSDLEKHIAEINVRLPAAFPMAVYVRDTADRTVFDMVLTFPGEKYAAMFEQVLTELAEGRI